MPKYVQTILMDYWKMKETGKKEKGVILSTHRWLTFNTSFVRLNLDFPKDKKCFITHI
jgi:hypothetical protein